MSSSKKMRGRVGLRSVAALAATAIAVGAVGAAASAYSSTDGWTSGFGNKRGVGNGLVLENFRDTGVGVYAEKWLGALNPNSSANTPSGMSSDFWCIETGVDIQTGTNYAWTTSNDVRMSYLMWLAENSWDNPDARGAAEYLIYKLNPTIGNNEFDANRIMNSPDFTQAAKGYAADFQALSDYSSEALELDKSTNPTSPTTGDLDNIGVRDAFGDLVTGIDYTITISGPAEFTNGSTTLTGTTGSSVIDNIGNWTANGNGQVTFSIEYEDATSNGKVYRGAAAGAQDLIGGAGVESLGNATDPAAVVNSFQPGGTSRVVTGIVPVGSDLGDTFTTEAVSGDWLRQSTAGFPFVPVTWDVTVYYAGMTAPVTSSTVPSGAVEAGTTQVTGTNGPGETLTASLGTAEKQGYYVYVWELNKANQPAGFRDMIEDDWADSFGIDDETVTSQAFQPSGESQVAEKVIDSSANLVDTFTTSTEDLNDALVTDQWITDRSGNPIPVTYDVSVFYAGDNDPDAAGTLVDAIQVTGTNGDGEDLTADFGTLADLGVEGDNGFYYFVWEFNRDSQPAATQNYFDGDWADAHNTDDETLSVTQTPSITSSISAFPTLDGVYLADTLFISGFDANHGDFTGGSGFAADAASITTTLYYFAPAVEVTDENIGQATNLGSVATNARNGIQRDLESMGFLTDAPGTYVFVSAFAGDDRTEPFTSSVTDENEQFYIGPGPLPEIATTATDGVDGDKIVSGVGPVTIIDEVCYENLVEDTEYVIDGVLMDKATGFPLLIDGEQVEASTTFTAGAEDDCVDVVFTFDGTSLVGGQELVVFEDATVEGISVATHADIEDEGQTVTVETPAPVIGTTATDGVDGDKSIDANSNVVVVDEVCYENLVEDTEYVMDGVLMDKATGEALLVNGEQVTASTPFTAGAEDDCVKVTFEFDGSDLVEGQQLVVFEVLTLASSGNVVAVHEDINDGGQTVTVGPAPAIGTTATDATDGDKTVTGGAKVIIDDEVCYENLVEDTEYVMDGVLMDKATGFPLLIDGEQVEASSTFTAGAEDDCVKVTFEFDGSDLVEGQQLVVFEVLTLASSGNVVAVHEDINDGGQTVTVEVPVVPEVPEEGEADGGASIDLAHTGPEALGLYAGVAALLMLAGAGAVLTYRRREASLDA